MKITIQPGTYVIAVSGGVDSMALLHVLLQQSDLKLIVAHFDHGIREDSVEDRRLAQKAAAEYGLQFVYHEGKLGQGASEDVARRARYDFLHKVRMASDATSIVTAHHQDDLLETAIHNMLRCTNRRGMVALRNREHVRRPLLGFTKQEIIAYAKNQGLQWREDSTNVDMRYRRNYIRRNILPKLSASQREELRVHIRNIEKLHDQIEHHLINHLHLHPGRVELDRHWFIMLPHAVAREVLAAWLRSHNITELTTDLLERLVVAAKSYQNKQMADINKDYVLYVDSDLLILRRRNS